jgi:hypothetical protein
LDLKYPKINKRYIKNLPELESKVQTWFVNAIGAKFFYMNTWLQNINFHAGNQWLVFDEQKQRFELMPQLDEEFRIVVNKILPSVRMAVGKIIQDRSRPVVMWTSQDEESIDAAKMATKLLEHIYRTSDFTHIDKQVVTWAALCGKGITKKYWDSKEEKICTEVIPPFELIVPPNVLKMEKMPWICHARFETKEWVYENYGLEVEGTSDWGQYGMFLAAVKNIMQDGNYTGVYTQGLQDNVMVKDWWIRPCKEYPQGALVIEVNNEIIYADKNPFNDDNEEFYWPFNEFDFFDAPYRFWPISLVEMIVDPQKYINEFYSNNLENMKYSGSPLWLAPEGAVVTEEWSNKPGSVNFYAPGMPEPKPVTPNPIPPVVFEQIAKFEQAIGEMSGIHFFGPGSLPPGVHAAAALAIINEQDQIAAMSVMTNHEKFLKEDARQTLFLIKKFGPKKMYIRVMGEEQQWEVLEFKKSYITGEEEIRIESKQELAADKMTKFEQVLKLMTTPGEDGKPILDTETGLRILDLEKDAGLVTPRFLNRNMAKDENERMAKGESVEVYQWEDHRVHIEAHLEFMLRIEFKQLDRKIQSIFMTHYQAHMQMLQNNQTQAGGNVGQEQPMMQGMQPGMQPSMPGMHPATFTPPHIPMSPDQQLLGNPNAMSTRAQQLLESTQNMFKSGGMMR